MNTPEPVTVQVSAAQQQSLLAQCQRAADAAYGDSNDGEIDALRDALSSALSLLGLSLPEGREPADAD